MTSLHRRALALVTALALSTSVVACTGGESSTAPSSASLSVPLAQAIDVEALLASRHPYVGDASKNLATLDALDLDAVGSLGAMEIRTEPAPNTLHLNFTALADGVTAQQAHTELLERGALALAMIDNAERIEWSLPGGVGGIDRSAAHEMAGGTLPDTGSVEQVRDLAAVIEGNVGKATAPWSRLSSGSARPTTGAS